MRRTILQRVGNRVAGHLHRPGQRVEAVSAVGDADQPLRQCAERAAQARIGRQRPDQRRRVLHLAGHPLEVCARQEQQAVAGEELAALRLLHRFEMRGVGGERGDRKSTRLNSSHMSISYAVFCLKKKKKKKKNKNIKKKKKKKNKNKNKKKKK